MLEYIAWDELILCWIVWVLAFVKPRREASGQKKTERAPSSRWGIVLVTFAYAVVWTYIRPRGYHQPPIQSASPWCSAPSPSPGLGIRAPPG